MRRARSLQSMSSRLIASASLQRKPPPQISQNSAMIAHVAEWIIGEPSLRLAPTHEALQCSVATLEGGWQQHVDGDGTAVPPQAPAKLTGSLWLIGGQPNCDNFSNSDQDTAVSFVENLAPAGAGSTTGMLGYMFWAAGCQGNGTGCTFPPNTCQNGMGGAATAFNIPIPMPALRQN